MTWPYRTYRHERAGETDWKRIFALPILVTSVIGAFYCLVGGRPVRSLPPGRAPWWLAFGLAFMGSQIAYCRRFRVAGDWFDSRWRWLAYAWVLWTLYFSYLWFMGARWLPPNPLGLVEYLVGGACFSSAWIAAGALVGIDLEQE